MWIPVILTGVLSIFLFLKAYRRPKNFPPGPRGLPLVGYAPFMMKLDPKKPYKALQKLAARYGPVCGFYVGPRTPFISVCGAKAVKEALHNDDLIGRPQSWVILNRTFGLPLGLIFSQGPFWQEQRRFTLRHLRDLGFGKTSIEDQMMDEINELIKEMTDTANADPNGVIDIKDEFFSVSVINILWAIVGGKRFERDDEDFKRLIECNSIFFQTANTTKSNIPIPSFIMKHFPQLKQIIDSSDANLLKPLQQFIQAAIDEHQLTRSSGEVPRDFIDVYLNEMDQQSQDPNTTFTNKQLVCLVLDLFSAGADTSTNSIGFAILYFINYPQVQAKVQAELDQVCGDKLPTLAHRSNLPYMEAFLMEVQRHATIAPTSPPRVAVKETQILGHTIPKDSVLLINFDSALTDATAWEEPDVFRPERHLKADGRINRNSASYVPFGAGKRACPGEPLAKNTFYLFVASLAKTFQFQAIEDDNPPTLEPHVGLTLSYKQFKTAIKIRP